MLLESWPLEYTMINEHESVILTRDVPHLGLRAGDVGIVVYVHTKPPGYEVEFVSTGGKTIGITSLEPDAVRELPADHVWSAHRLAAMR
jgi:hypothetical protein